MRTVFVCSPYRGNTREEVKQNVEVAKRACAAAVSSGFTVICPHLLFPRFMKDREKGIEAGLALLAHADEMWVVGDRITEGMAREVGRAGELGIPIKQVMDPLTAEERLIEALMLFEK